MLVADLDSDALGMAKLPGDRSPTTRKVPGPKNDLAGLKTLFRLASIGKQRATREVAVRLGIGEPEAEAFIRQRLATLEPGNYAGTFAMEWDETVVADVY